MNTIIEKYIRNRERPGKGKNSVRLGHLPRFIKADEQEKVCTDDIQNIINYVIEFIELAGIKSTGNHVVNSKNYNKKFYEEIKEKHNLENTGDIIWMKFTTDGYLGVVAAGKDINYKYNNTSGILIKHLGKEWDESFVLVFPLENLSESKLTRSEVETGIGNYLIDKGVSILDYYSHRY